jgi:hypothetical protein
MATEEDRSESASRQSRDADGLNPSARRLVEKLKGSAFLAALQRATEEHKDDPIPDLGPVEGDGGEEDAEGFDRGDEGLNVAALKEMLIRASGRFAVFRHIKHSPRAFVVEIYDDPDDLGGEPVESRHFPIPDTAAGGDAVAHALSHAMWDYAESRGAKIVLTEGRP